MQFFRSFLKSLADRYGLEMLYSLDNPWLSSSLLVVLISKPRPALPKISFGVFFNSSTILAQCSFFTPYFSNSAIFCTATDRAAWIFLSPYAAAGFKPMVELHQAGTSSSDWATAPQQIMPQRCLTSWIKHDSATGKFKIIGPHYFPWNLLVGAIQEFSSLSETLVCGLVGLPNLRHLERRNWFNCLKYYLEEKNYPVALLGS